MKRRRRARRVVEVDPPESSGWLRRHRQQLATLAFVVAHLAGFLTSVRALMDTRTSQGAIAWVISLNTFPWVAVPSYWVFGQSEFKGYVVARRADLEETREVEARLMEQLKDEDLYSPSDDPVERLLEHLVHMPLTRGNAVDLLVDGEATFDAIFEALERARNYILVQFFIIKDDDLGQRLKEALSRKAREGVRVYVIYDEVGSSKLSKAYLAGLREAGVRIEAFNTTQGRANRFQLNFRNHRKIVVVDGIEAFVGGHNVGDEYIDGGAFPTWRDTHVRLEGPVVQTVQVPFAEDWYWATQELLLNLDWDPRRSADQNMGVSCIPTGPADEFESCTMFFLALINQARERLWIASPYFVPDESVAIALQMAALRGVDVRILIPNDPDHMIVYLSAFSYLENAERAGVKIYRYEPGFMHQKVVLMDRSYASVGTANLDNRSFRLNFEIMMLIDDVAFNSEVAAMLEEDFKVSRLVDAKEYTEASFPFRLAVRACRLLAPVQ